MVKIYTKTGDEGQTGLFGGERVSKSHLRIRAYGEVHELNATLGIIRSQGNEAPAIQSKIDPVLQKIQNDLFDLGALLATPHEDKKRLLARATRFLNEDDVAVLEKEIDVMEQELPPLKNFILPGGDSVGALVHWACTICRRAEREIISLAESEKEAVEADVLKYMNRLSDFLFVLARWVNFKNGVLETKWEKK